jgi:transposase
MQLQSILNRVQKYRSFTYGPASWVQTKGRPGIEVELRARKNGRPVCSGCSKVRPGYDRLPPRRVEFIPMWGLAIFFLYAMRRVSCPSCGVVVEKVPWVEGKEQQAKAYQWFLAHWAKRLPWKQVAQAFGTTWDLVYKAVHMAVVWGLEHRSLEGIEAIGADEIQWLRGHKYLTLVYQISQDTKRLLYIAKDRTEESLRTFFHMLGSKRCAALKYVCSDMWQAYLKVIQEMAGKAVHVLDRFHIMKKFNEAIDEVRREEVRRMKQQGYEPVLRHARWCLLKRPDRLKGNQATKLKELLSYNLRSVRAYLLREEFQRFWEYKSPAYIRQGVYIIGFDGQAQYLQSPQSGGLAGAVRPHEHAHALRLPGKVAQRFVVPHRESE